MTQFIGKDLSVLTENHKNEYTYGHTGNYLQIKIKGIYESDKILNVRLISMEYPYLLGEVND